MKILSHTRLFLIVFFSFITLSIPASQAQAECNYYLRAENYHLPADGVASTKLEFMICDPGGTLKFYLGSDKIVCNYDLCGHVILPPSISEDVPTYATYCAPYMEPTVNVSGIMKVRVVLVYENGDLSQSREINIDLDIGEYIAPLSSDLYFSNKPLFFEYGRNEIVVQPLDDNLKPITEPHSLKFSVEPSPAEITMIPANGIQATIAGKATVDLFISEPAEHDDFGKTNYITLKVEDLTLDTTKEWDIPLGSPLMVLAKPDNPNDDNDNHIAIIPADVNYPAKITATLGGNLDYETKADRKVVFLIEPGNGELRGHGQAGYLINAVTDEYGRAEVYYHFTGTYDGKKIIDTVIIEDDTGEEAEVDVQIGLGLRLDEIEAYLRAGKTALTTSSQFGILAIIASEFYPGLVLEDYVRWAKDIWSGKEIGMYLDLEWLNKPDPEWWEWLIGSTLDNETYKGPCSFGQKGSIEEGYDILVAKVWPFESIGGIYFPSIWIKSNGGHLFKATVKLIDVNSGGEIQETPLMPFRFFEATVDSANSYLRDLTCAMSPNTKAEFLLQELFKKIPGNVGWGVSLFLAVRDIACKVAQKDYSGAVLATGSVVGGEMLTTILPKYGPKKIPESTFDLYATGMNTKEVAEWYVIAENLWKLKWKRESGGLPRQDPATSTEPDVTLTQLSNAFPVGMLTSIASYSDKQIITVVHAQSAELRDENGTPAVMFDDDFSPTGEMVGARVEDVFSFIVPKEGRYILRAKIGEGACVTISENSKVYQYYDLSATTSANVEVVINDGNGGILNLDFDNNGSVDQEIDPVEEIIMLRSMEIDFNDGRATNWVDDGAGVWSPSEDHYVMSGKQQNRGAYSYFNTNLTDFTCQVDLRKTAGDNDDWLYGYGLYIRGDGTWRNNYEFNIVKNGSYMIGKNINGNFTKLVGYTSTDALDGNGWNTLKVVAQADNIKFYANNQFLTEIIDDSFSVGKIGLFAVDTSASTVPDVVEFDDFQFSRGETLCGNYNYFLPYYHSDPRRGFWTGIGLANAEVEDDTQVKVKLLGQDGKPLDEEISFSLRANEQLALPMAAELEETGWLQIGASNPLSGLAFVGGDFMADISFIEELSTSLVIPHIAQNEIWDTSILVCNPHASSTEIVISNFYAVPQSSASSEAAIDFRQCKRILPVMGSARYSLAEIFPEEAPLDGMIILTAKQGVAAFALYENTKSGGQYYAGINAAHLSHDFNLVQKPATNLIESLGAASLPLNYNYFLPYYHSDPRQGLWTGIGLANAEVEDNTQVTVKVLGQHGQPLKDISFSLLADGQRALPVAAELDEIGWIQIESSNPLAGLAFVASKFMADIPFIEELSTSLIIPHVAQNEQWDTSILVCNPHAGATKLLISNFYNTRAEGGAGINLRQSQRTLAEMGSAKYSLAELFPGQEPLNGMVVLTAEQGVAAFSLYENIKSGGQYHAGINAVQLNRALDFQ